MIRNRFFTAFIGAALVGAMAIGCDSEDTKAYDVDITWNIGGGQTCSWIVEGETISLENVTVTVYTAEGDVDPLNDAVTVPCSDLAYTIPRLNRGTYFVEVAAWGEYDGENLPIMAAAKTINAPYAEGDDNEFVLLQAPGDIHVTWIFPNSMGCENNEAETVKIITNDDVIDDVECGPQEYTVTDQTAFVEQSVTVEAYDTDGEKIFEGVCDENPFYLLPGEIYDAIVYLE
jgi:hypothetical protein